MAKRYYYCHNCERGTEVETRPGKPVFCRYCGRMINLAELKEYTLSKAKKPVNAKKKK